MKLSKRLVTSSFFYIYIPVIIFLVGFLKIWIALPVAAITSCVLFYSVKDLLSFCDDEKTLIKNDIGMIFGSLLITAVCIGVGFGGLLPQAGDWYKHNAVLKDMVYRVWPVIYNNSSNSMLTYYLGQYLLPAFIGKLFYSFDLANTVMSIYGILGVLLVYVNLCRIVQANTLSKQVITSFILLFFSGALPLVQVVCSGLFADRMYSLGSYHWLLVDKIMLQYRSNLVMLRWVYPQVIATWLIAELLIIYKDKVKYWCVIILPAFLFACFSFLSFVITLLIVLFIMIIYVMQSNMRDKNVQLFKDVFSYSNIFLSLIPGIIIFLYFYGNISTKKPASSSFSWQLYRGDEILAYFVFIFFMCGIYIISLWKDYYKESLFLGSVLILIALPFTRMGLCNDIVMSGSIPSLFFIMIYICDFLFNNDGGQLKKGIIICILCIGAWYPLLELRDNLNSNKKGMEVAMEYSTMERFANRELKNVSEDLQYNYYTYDLEDDFFYKYLAKH